jgi:hypothetical protein
MKHTSGKVSIVTEVQKQAGRFHSELISYAEKYCERVKAWLDANEVDEDSLDCVVQALEIVSMTLQRTAQDFRGTEADDGSDKAALQTLKEAEAAEREAREQVESTFYYLNGGDLPSIEQIEKALTPEEPVADTIEGEIGEQLGAANDLAKDLETWVKAATRLIEFRACTLEA